MLQNLFRSYFARFMYPLAQAFVLSKILRGVLLCIPFWIYDIGLTWYVRNNAFFWDTVQLASKHGLFYYENDFSSLLLPDAIDSGHPPFFGMYIALCWKIFGKTLIVSHLSILPFLMGITWQALKFGEKILGEWQTFLFILLLKINPIMAGQSTLVSPDIPLAFFFLLALNSIFNQNNFKNNVLLSISILGLSMISMRGMMVAAALFIFQGYLLYFQKYPFKKEIRVFQNNNSSHNTLPFRWYMCLEFSQFSLH
jgi:4-amino-4-deoxy-L-arabinose transferase-like glycosyltransferase